MTRKTLTADRPAKLILQLPAGRANITIDPSTDQATVTVSTDDHSGPAADAVNAATAATKNTVYTVSVPGPTTALGGAGRSYHRASAGSVVGIQADTVVGANVNVVQKIGTIEPGAEVTLIRIGDARPAPAPADDMATAASIRVDATVPPGTAVEIEGLDVDLTTDGRLESLGFNAISGSVNVDTAADINIDVASADVRISEVLRDLRIKTISGNADIANYHGVRGSVRTTTGTITVAVTGTASGQLTLRSTAGDIKVTGAGALDDIDADSMSGSTRIVNR